MRTLYVGLVGTDVLSWKYFLIGINPNSHIVADSTFDHVTLKETKKFQKDCGLLDDGIVGPATMGKAMTIGYNPLSDERIDENGPNWPPTPIGFSPLSTSDRIKLFGKFEYVSAPTKFNPEAINITDNWAQLNIATVEIPQLKKIIKSGNVLVHKLLESQIKNFFSELETNNLCDKVLTWGGSWAPRFIRGSRTALSNHAWGTAFDINVQWNMLGTLPALKGQKGSVRELVEIANKNGFYWGGHFKGRPDGMHFEAYKIINP